MTQDEKKICLLQLISEEPYIVWLSFMVNKCKMISFFLKKNGFYFSKILIFWVVRRVKGQKMTENDIKNLSHSMSQELYFIWLWFLVHMCKVMISPAFFFSFFFLFQNSDFSGFSKFINNAKRKFWGVPHLLHTCEISFF